MIIVLIIAKKDEDLAAETDTSISLEARGGSLVSNKGTFLARIQPSQNCNAEQELSRNLGKDSFDKMQVIGQFNLGFIIAKLNNDLFIVDQVFLVLISLMFLLVYLFICMKHNSYMTSEKSIF